MRYKYKFSKLCRPPSTFLSSAVLYHDLQVCNHPDLFEGRPIVSAFDFPGLELRLPSIATKALEVDACSGLDFRTLKLVPCQHEGMAQWEAATVKVQCFFLPVG